jgi:hypothetical protein
MAGRYTALVSCGALALAIGSSVAAGEEKAQSKLPSSPAVIVAPVGKERTVISATTATVVIPAAPAQEKKNSK